MFLVISMRCFVVSPCSTNVNAIWLLLVGSSNAAERSKRSFTNEKIWPGSKPNGKNSFTFKDLSNRSNDVKSWLDKAIMGGSFMVSNKSL